jgi:hypothetical protein
MRAACAASSVFRISVSHIDKPLIRRQLTGKTRANSMCGHYSRNLALGQEAVLAVHIQTSTTLADSACGEHF